MIKEENLKYKIVKASTDDSGIAIPDVSESDHVYKFVIHDDSIFQRFRIFKNGLIVCEEVSNGQRIFRSNRPL